MARNHTTSFQVWVIAAVLSLVILLPAASAAARHTIPNNNNVRQFLPRRSRTALNLEPVLLVAENRTRAITVRKDGRGDFTTVADAVNSIPAGVSRRTVIHIGPGLYREKVTVDSSKPFVTFYGDPHAMPRISFDGTAAQFGTFLSATVAVESRYFVACNIIFENTAPRPADGQMGAQAVAMRISGDKAAFYNCRFHGHQDTLCDDRGRHYFKNCFVTGTVDFVFGNGRSLYRNCELRSVADGATTITAQGRENISDKSGFSFVSCRISGTGDAFLSRAWKPRSRVVFARTYMGGLVNPSGWSDKGFPDRQRTVYYGEYKCTGPGSGTRKRVNYGKILNDRQARPFLSKDFINGATWLLPPPRLRPF